MGIDKIVNEVLNYVHLNPLGSAAAGIILLFFLLKKPKLFFILVLVCAAGIGVMSIFDNLSSTGVTGKDFGSLGELR